MKIVITFEENDFRGNKEFFGKLYEMSQTTNKNINKKDALSFDDMMKRAGIGIDSALVETGSAPEHSLEKTEQKDEKVENQDQKETLAERNEEKQYQNENPTEQAEKPKVTYKQLWAMFAKLAKEHGNNAPHDILNQFGVQKVEQLGKADYEKAVSMIREYKDEVQA